MSERREKQVIFLKEKKGGIFTFHTPSESLPAANFEKFAIKIQAMGPLSPISRCVVVLLTFNLRNCQVNHGVEK